MGRIATVRRRALKRTEVKFESSHIHQSILSVEGGTTSFQVVGAGSRPVGCSNSEKQVVFPNRSVIVTAVVMGLVYAWFSFMFFGIVAVLSTGRIKLKWNKVR